MSAKSNYLRIGIFVLVGLVLLIAGLLAFGARSYFSQKTRFETAVEGDVSGLSVGSSVQLRGVPIGKVTLITFGWHAYPGSKSHDLIVEFEVDSDLMPWPPGNLQTLINEATGAGLRAVVKGQGITGSSLLSLETVNPAPVPPTLDYTPHNYYIPSAPGQFTRILETVERSLQNLEKVDFAGIGNGITNVLGVVGKLGGKLDALDLETITTNANAVLLEVKSAAVKLQDGLAQIQRTLGEMKLEQIGENANTLISNLRATNVRLLTLLGKLNAVPMQETFGDLQQTLATLNDVLVELQRYPSGFFLGSPPAGAKAIQTGSRQK